MEPTNAPFDEALVMERRKRAFGNDPEGHFLMLRACEDLIERLQSVSRNFNAPVTLFCGGNYTAQAIKVVHPETRPLMLEAISIFGGEAIGQLSNFALQPSGYDLAVSLLAMQSVNDLTGFLIQSRLCLKPDGLFLGCLFGVGTLQELRSVLLEAEAELYGGASPRVAPLADVRDMGGLLQRAGFALPVADHETHTVRYANMFALLRDLRAMGITNSLHARSRKPLSKAFWAKAAEIYASKFSDTDGRIRATFSIIWLSGWAPSEFQPKPLKPGSATVSLKDVLQG